MTDPTAKILLRLAHSPDPDDAFMWWPLFSIDGQLPRLNTDNFRFEQVTTDIESLNQRAVARNDELEITALSCATFARVCDRYALTACGASMGDAYGPKVVAKTPMSVDDLSAAGMRIAIPGEGTTAFAALRMLLGPCDVRFNSVPFKDIIDAVASGTYPAGLIIHEGQLTLAASGLHQVVDLGAWWKQSRGLPLPLGVNAIRRDLDVLHGPGTLVRVASLLRNSVEYALTHREESVAYALRFARDMTPSLADEFIRLYVNKWTLDFGDSGREAVRVFLDETHHAGLTPAASDVQFVG